MKLGKMAEEGVSRFGRQGREERGKNLNSTLKNNSFFFLLTKTNLNEVGGKDRKRVEENL